MESTRSASELEERLGHKFKDPALLELALTHRSVPGQGEKLDYERLEYLGDAVLDLGVADLLLMAHPEAREGELSKMRAALVNAQSLAEIAREIDLGPFIKLSRGELANGGSDRTSILSDVLEALIGAIYRDAGFEAALKSLKHLFQVRVGQVVPRDPKTELQEALHAAGHDAPQYLLECVEGPEHAPTFVSLVQVKNRAMGRGRGPTKKASQQAAAAEALILLREGSSDEKST